MALALRYGAIDTGVGGGPADIIDDSDKEVTGAQAVAVRTQRNTYIRPGGT